MSRYLKLILPLPSKIAYTNKVQDPSASFSTQLHITGMDHILDLTEYDLSALTLQNKF